MGYGSYSHDAHRALTSSRATVSRESLFKQRACHPLMNPKDVGFRECRDSAEHPESLGVIFALDVTGSMGSIPDGLARRELPTFMKTLVDCGIDSAQVLFTAVGDAISDRAPLQVGQFESEAELMDQWLTWSFLEGGGGGSGEESYELALYFAARHTRMDCLEKRGKKGYFFMTGDEHPYPRLSKAQVAGLIGDEVAQDVPIERVIDEVSLSYHPFFIVPDLSRARRCERRWRDLLGDHVIVLERSNDVCLVAASAVALNEGAIADLDFLARRMRDSGVERDQVGSVIRALTPFAATLDRPGRKKVHPESKSHSARR